MSGDMNGAPAGVEAAAGNLRFLRILVTVLAGTMIAGLLTIIALIVIRFPAAMEPRPVLPDTIALPEGARAEAVTMGRGWIGVVTDDGHFLIFDAGTGALRQTVAIAPGG